jgi:TatD DNase family protein
MLIDTHAHVNFKYFRDDADDVIRRSLGEATWMINVGADFKSSRRALEYANRYERGVYAAIGLHPMHLFAYRAEADEYDFETRGEDYADDAYDQLARFEKTVAVGEIGLDYYHLDIGVDAGEIKRRQREVFLRQLELARRHDLPAIIHCRQAHDDMLAVLTEFRKENRMRIPADRPWAVMHCFSGDEDLAWQYFKLGLVVSFTGLITFSRQWDDLIRKLPPDKYMVETDCPFLTRWSPM